MKSIFVHPAIYATFTSFLGIFCFVAYVELRKRWLQAQGTLFALTLQDSFFHRLGFRTVPKELFPLKVWADCRTCPTRWWSTCPVRPSTI